MAVGEGSPHPAQAHAHAHAHAPAGASAGVRGQGASSHCPLRTLNQGATELRGAGPAVALAPSLRVSLTLPSHRVGESHQKPQPKAARTVWGRPRQEVSRKVPVAPPEPVIYQHSGLDAGDSVLENSPERQEVRVLTSQHWGSPR